MADQKKLKQLLEELDSSPSKNLDIFFKAVKLFFLEILLFFFNFFKQSKKKLNEESIKSSDGMDIFHYFFIQVLNKLKFNFYSLTSLNLFLKDFKFKKKNREPTSQIGALRKLQSELNNKISLKGYCCSKKWLQRSLKFLSENYSVYSKEVIGKKLIRKLFLS